MREALRKLEHQEKVNAALGERNLQLQGNNDVLKKQILAEITKRSEYELLAGQLSERTRDIPLHEVMDKMNYAREQIGQTHFYRDAEGQVALLINQNVMRDSEDRVLARNSLDLVVHMQNEYQGRNITHMDAMNWLADNFGEARAGAAYRAEREQALNHYFDERGRRKEEERDRARPEQQREQTFERSNRTQGHMEYDRLEHDHASGPDRGGPEHDIGFSR